MAREGNADQGRVGPPPTLFLTPRPSRRRTRVARLAAPHSSSEIPPAPPRRADSLPLRPAARISPRLPPRRDARARGRRGPPRRPRALRFRLRGSWRGPGQNSPPVPRPSPVSSPRGVLTVLRSCSQVPDGAAGNTTGAGAARLDRRTKVSECTHCV